MLHLFCSKVIKVDCRDIIAKRDRPDLLNVGLVFDFLLDYRVCLKLRVGCVRSVHVSLEVSLGIRIFFFEELSLQLSDVPVDFFE